jgi:hypothetical protein
MHELSVEQVHEVSGAGALGTLVGEVIGGTLAGVAAMASMAATGGGSAMLAIGIVGAASRIGGSIGSAIEDSFY